MSTLPKLIDADPEFAAVMADASSIYEDALADDDAFPDVAAMLARARELDSDAVSEDMVEAGRRSGADTPFAALPEPSAQLAPYIRAYREVVESTRFEAPVASLLKRRAQPDGRRLSTRWAAAVAGAAWIWAATAVAAFGAIAYTVARDDRPWSMAGDDMHSPITHEASDAPPPAAEPTADVRPAPPQPQPQPQLGSGPAIEREADSTSAPTPATTRPASRPSPRRRAGAREAIDPLAARNAEALRRWHEGDLEGAEALFRETVRTGRGRYVQLAYGDLSLLVRQLHGREAQSELWREYLSRHPQGRFADDWSAGLCRRSAERERQVCWQMYLEAHPDGAHAAEAREAP